MGKREYPELPSSAEKLEFEYVIDNLRFTLPFIRKMARQYLEAGNTDLQPIWGLFYSYFRTRKYSVRMADGKAKEEIRGLVKAFQKSEEWE